ncbi:coiled-coil domain-containing protein [Lactococcus allomyrinae]|uniref:CHAP domain-containing protein n=1 Tax=Lactococcus allomyrinae TaxID=2419773 RepID=A0A387BK13_9LACT|nr:CHAP domain-containing protein [Lactococcus allomyrinae]AYG01356.1 CHAP domain-containing protein [Lactococcus allomyrinae]
MKKRIISAILLSTVVLSTAAPVSGVYADTNSDIQKQDATIASAQSAKAQAQAQVDSLQAKVDSIQQKQSNTQKQINAIKSQAESLNKQIATLSQNIADRTNTLEAQARSAQVNNSATNYLDAIVNSKSLTDAVQKITAMATVSSANKQMLEQQVQDKKALDEKSESVKKNYNKFVSLSQDLDSQAQELTSQQAELKVATLNYQATIATAQGKKNSLLAEKAVAEKAAQEAASKQAAYEAQQKASQEAQAKSTQAVDNTASGNSTNTSNNDGGSKTPTPTPTPTPSPNPGPGGNNTPIANPYAGGGCTDYVWQYFAAQGIYIRNISPGNGGQWATNGPAQGILHVVSAAPGVIVSGYTTAFVGYSGSPYGHVAIVTKVNSNGTINVIEGGYGSGWWGHTRENIPTAGLTFLMPN